MSVLQIIKDRAGEQDINFGDSDTTFNRQTHTGGTVAINYVDAKSIPANALGGVVDTHLHTQNTDTGTTQTSFYINSAGNHIRLDATGQTGDVTFTFPTSGSQGLTGVTDLASTAASKGATLVGVRDTAGHFDGVNVETVLAELATDVEALSAFRGLRRGFKLGYSSTTAVTISGGMWDHRGTTTRQVYTASQLSFTLGSGGSNAGSDNLTASALQYIYIDDSAVVSSGSDLLTATEFVNSTTAPTYSNAKCGWYNGLDRCIGAILTTATSVIVEFQVTSSGFMGYTAATSIVAFSSSASPTSSTELDLGAIVPSFSTCAKLSLTTNTDAITFFFGSTTGHNWNDYVTSSGTTAYMSVTTALSATQKVDWYGSGANTVALLLTGYYMDEL